VLFATLNAAESVEEKKILVVDDEPDIVQLLQYRLRREGFRVFSAGSAETALRVLHRVKPDLAVVDVMLPRMDGLDLCRLIRKESQVPVILLTAKRTETDRIVGLKLGADDYITKPFSFGELVARINAVLRRSSPDGASSKAPKRRAVSFGKMEIDFDSHEIRIRGKAVNLTPKEFEILRHLIESRGKVLSREELLEAIWGYNRATNLDTRTVDQHVARLRRKLEPENGRIATLTRYGYQFKSG